MRDGNLSLRTEIKQHLWLYNNFFIQRFSQADNEQINTREDARFSWAMQYRIGIKIPRIRWEANLITLSPNSAAAVKVPLSKACSPNVKQTLSAESRGSTWRCFKGWRPVWNHLAEVLHGCTFSLTDAAVRPLVAEGQMNIQTMWPVWCGWGGEGALFSSVV